MEMEDRKMGKKREREILKILKECEFKKKRVKERFEGRFVKCVCD